MRGVKSKDLAKQAWWEARRIAAAFELQDWVLHIAEPENYMYSDVLANSFHLKGYTRCFKRVWAPLSWSDEPLWDIEICRGDPKEYNIVRCSFVYREGKPSVKWGFMEIEDPDPTSSCWLLACALFRLGLYDEDTCSELGATFSFHDELELRLSMPREFWPQKWLDEEAAKNE